MPFTRTNNGLSNLHLFYDADITLFTEGGSQTFTYEQVENQQYSDKSVDIKFWKTVFEAHGFKKKIAFKAVGSKTTARAISEKIINEDVTNIAVAKDRDLDNYTKGVIDSPFILYTKGYSWENDVFTRETTLSQINSMMMMTSVPDEVIDIIDKAYEDFRVFGKNLAKLEIIFRKKGIAFISDLNGERFFNYKKSTFINKEHVLSVLAVKKQKLIRPVNVNVPLKGVCPFLHNFGKLLEALSLNIINYVCRKYDDYKSIPKRMIVSAMLEQFARKVNQSSDKYYFHLVNRLQNSIS